MKRFLLLSIVTTAVTLTFSNCSKSAPASAAAAAAPAKHEHHAPHGGTPVVLGDEAYHLELVRDADAGKLTAYVLDGEMEEFIRVKAPTFEVVAVLAHEHEFILTFRAISNTATGESIGNTSQFEAQAPWLKDFSQFDGTITSLEIKGTTFSAVAFNFPKGNDKD